MFSIPMLYIFAIAYHDVQIWYLRYVLLIILFSDMIFDIYLSILCKSPLLG